MRTISPNLEGIEEITIAEEQQEYKTLVAAALYDTTLSSSVIVLRWKLTPEERQKLIAGEDLWTTHLAFGNPFQPLTADVGKPDWLPKIAG
jgi:hypothetical protein